MTVLIILFSILIGYLFFMMSFYLIAKVLFPRIEQSPEQEELLAQMEIRSVETDQLAKEAARRAKRSKVSYRFNKQPQIA